MNIDWVKTGKASAHAAVSNNKGRLGKCAGPSSVGPRGASPGCPAGRSGWRLELRGPHGWRAAYSGKGCPGARPARKQHPVPAGGRAWERQQAPPGALLQTQGRAGKRYVWARPRHRRVWAPEQVQGREAPSGGNFVIPRAVFRGNDAVKT